MNRWTPWISRIALAHNWGYRSRFALAGKFGPYGYPQRRYYTRRRYRGCW